MQVKAEKYLPAWPVAAVLVLYLVWWAVGIVDVIWVIAALAMLGCLVQARRLQVPRGFGLWLVFITIMLASFVMVDRFNDAVEFAFRGSTYLAVTVVFVYVYNARRALNDVQISGLLTVFWLWTVLGGFIGLVLPNTRFRTPSFYVLNQISDRITSIQFINEMVVRRFAQYNPDSFLGTPARPSLPFTFANNWGSVYSLLLPFVIAYMIEVRGTVKFWLLAVAVPVSLVPAFLSLNRGMLIGLLVSSLYVAGRLALRARFLPLGLLLAGVLAAAAVFNAIAASRLEARVSDSSTGTRAYLYTESFALAKGSPFFGYGVPVQTLDPDKPPIGTQGQFWMLLVSHGVIATAAFMLFFVGAWWVSRHRRDPVTVAATSVVLVGLVELFFYGMVPYGLPILMIAAAVAMRPVSRPPDLSPYVDRTRAVVAPVVPRSVPAQAASQ